MKKLIILTGTSAAGKGTIMNLLTEDTDLEITKLVRYTTRNKREGEVPGQSYHFVSLKEFGEIKHSGDFVDAFEFPLGWFGTSKNELIEQFNKNDTIAVDLDVEAALNLIDFAKEENISYIDVFLIPGKKEDISSKDGISRILRNLEARMIERNNGFQIQPEDLKVRLTYARKWIRMANKFSHIVSNETDQVNKAFKEIKTIISDN